MARSTVYSTMCKVYVDVSTVRRRKLWAMLRSLLFAAMSHDIFWTKQSAVLRFQALVHLQHFNFGLMSAAHSRQL